MLRQFYLINTQITPKILAGKPKLVDKYNPNPNRYTEIVEVVEGPWGRAGYRLLTWLERGERGASYRPAEINTLSDIRFQYAVWIGDKTADSVGFS